MVEFRSIDISLLDPNEGQIPGLPANPRQWTDAEVRRLARSMKQTPELAIIKRLNEHSRKAKS